MRRRGSRAAVQSDGLPLDGASTSGGSAAGNSGAGWGGDSEGARMDGAPLQSLLPTIGERENAPMDCHVNSCVHPEGVCKECACTHVHALACSM
eukprot:354244-Chlamydomonas_euryale.AAC.6